MDITEVLRMDSVRNAIVMNRLYSDVIYAFKIGKSIE